MLFYIVGGICLILLLFGVYIRLRFRFWSLQPVFHFYDVYYWFVNVGIIQKELPERNKYVNQTQIQTKPGDTLDKLRTQQIIRLLKSQYYRNRENKYDPDANHVLPYFVGHNMPTFWSYYVEPELCIDNKTGKTIEENKIVGVISSRPLHVVILNHSSSSSSSSSSSCAELDVYYVDYLCVHKNWRKKNIAPQLIQTHEYNQSHANKKISVSLFKREEELTGIIPLTVYKTYCFSMAKWRQPSDLPANITLLTGDKQNMYYVYNFFKESFKPKTKTKTKTKTNIKTKWDIMIYPEMSNLMELCASKNLFIKMLMIQGDIAGLYIFRKTCTFIEKDNEIICCIASMKGPGLSNDIFIQGFKLSLWSIISFHKFHYVTIEDISDNTMLINNLCAKTFPIAISPMAYFFYNFAYSPFKSSACFIIQ